MVIVVDLRRISDCIGRPVGWVASSGGYTEVLRTVINNGPQRTEDSVIVHRTSRFLVRRESYLWNGLKWVAMRLCSLTEVECYWKQTVRLNAGIVGLQIQTVNHRSKTWKWKTLFCPHFMNIHRTVELLPSTNSAANLDRYLFFICSLKSILNFRSISSGTCQWVFCYWTWRIFYVLMFFVVIILMVMHSSPKRRTTSLMHAGEPLKLSRCGQYCGRMVLL